MDLTLLSPSTATRTNHTTLFSDEESAAAAAWFTETGKQFVAFLSHHKESCATEARLVKGELDSFFEGAEAFLDSDNLQAGELQQQYECVSATMRLDHSLRVASHLFCARRISASCFGT